MLLSNDRMVMVVYSTTQIGALRSKVLVDSVAYDETYSRFAFDASAGYAM